MRTLTATFPRFSVHAQNQSRAAGTAFAISYQVRAPFTFYAYSQLIYFFHQSDINKVTPDNLVVFSVRYKYVHHHHHLRPRLILIARFLASTPWKRVVHYDVPAAMPPCPAGGCICAVRALPNPFLLFSLTVAPSIFCFFFSSSGAGYQTGQPNPPIFIERRC
jgi:hypothetical protein